MDNKQNRETNLVSLHASGVRLDDAWVVHAKFFDQFAYRALRTDPANDADVLGLEHPRYQQLSKGWLPKTADSRRDKLEIVTRNERSNLFDEIYHGNLWALGNRTLDDGSDEVVRVPRQHFFVGDEKEEVFQRIKWKKGEMRVGSESYFDIRIVEPPANPERASTQPDTPPAKKCKGGRPGTKNQIEDCVRSLLNNSEFAALNRTKQAEEVRAKILGEPFRGAHDYSGYKTTTIVRYIGQFLNTEHSN